MGRRVRVVLAITAALSLLVLAGCTGGGEQAESDEKTEIWGYIASEKSAQLEVEENQLGAEEIVVERVLAPEDAWIVIHADDNGQPGMRIGLKAIGKGESTDVRVELDEMPSEKVFVVVHADRAADDEFDFDMMAKEMSPDRPFFVGGKELAKVVKVAEPGAAETAMSTEASIMVSDQVGATGSLLVDEVTVPSNAWLVVHLEKDGGPGQRIGVQSIEAGSSDSVTVRIDPVPLTDRLLVAVHNDGGQAGVFEYNMDDMENSPDKPFFVDQKEVAEVVRVK